MGWKNVPQVKNQSGNLVQIDFYLQMHFSVFSFSFSGLEVLSFPLSCQDMSGLSLKFCMRWPELHSDFQSYFTILF